MTGRKSFTLEGLRRLTAWGGMAACALLAAALTSRSQTGLERIAAVLHPDQPQQVAARSFDAQTETRQLAEQLRGLAANDELLKTRLAAVERDMNDMTGSISKQIEAVNAGKDGRAEPSADDGPTVAMTAAVSTSGVAPAPLPAGAQLASAAPADEAGMASRVQYGADIGNGLTMEAVRARWLAIRGMRPQLFENLEPLVGVKDAPHSNRIELRLIAGPFAQASGAAQFCTKLSQMGLYCQPTMFDGQRLPAH